MGLRGHDPWTGSIDPLRKYGALGAIATMILFPVLALIGVPPGLERWLVAAWIAAMFYFATIFFVGTFRKFDREAYPVLVGTILIPLAVLLLLVATGTI